MDLQRRQVRKLFGSRQHGTASPLGKDSRTLSRTVRPVQLPRHRRLRLRLLRPPSAHQILHASRHLLLSRTWGLRPRQAVCLLPQRPLIAPCAMLRPVTLLPGCVEGLPCKESVTDRLQHVICLSSLPELWPRSRPPLPSHSFGISIKFRPAKPGFRTLLARQDLLSWRESVLCVVVGCREAKKRRGE